LAEGSHPVIPLTFALLFFLPQPFLLVSPLFEFLQFTFPPRLFLSLGRLARQLSFQMSAG